MNLNDKIIKIRKENAWTQEDFANKLNVEKQVISEWESGQNRPDNESLNKIASAFGMSIDELLNENEEPVIESKLENKKENGKRGPTIVFFLIIILIIVVMGLFLTILNKVYNVIVRPVEPKSIIETLEEKSVVDIIKSVPDQIIEITDTITFNMQAPKRRADSFNNSFNVHAFNGGFETLYFGNTDGFFMQNFIDEVIESNQKNPFHIIVVKYEDVETSDANELRKLASRFEKNNDYNIIYDYNVEGYIRKATIQKNEKPSI